MKITSFLKSSRFLSNTLFSISFPIHHPHKKLLEKGHLFLSKCVCRTYIFYFSACLLIHINDAVSCIPFYFYFIPVLLGCLGLFMLLDSSLLIAAQRSASVFAYSHRDDSQIGPHALSPQKKVPSVNIFVVLHYEAFLTYSGSKWQVTRT